MSVKARKALLLAILYLEQSTRVNPFTTAAAVSTVFKKAVMILVSGNQIGQDRPARTGPYDMFGWLGETDQFLLAFLNSKFKSLISDLSVTTGTVIS